ncbi:putative acyltransferase [Scedosporium apiospermum]|uniref:1-acyl-sn-glycerol-3-phosphate acyltransferase n=1 Tax=Pseudallescheria apiosperma TaxID=563466 RepID=A0A084G5K6_PSEDA|nr:putative acyltransferase [Scedosporium apiospermum]KEZ42618.1 putative acyltransferase [Scedosporium apiospermum]
MWDRLVSYLTTFWLGAAVLVAALYMVSFVVPKAAFVARALTGYLCLLIASCMGLLICIVFRLFGIAGSSQWAAGRVFKYAMYLTTGVTFEIIDPHGVLDNTRPAVVVGNHQTELDVLMLGCMFPRNCTVTAKASLKKIPFLGWFMALSKTIFIDRGNAKDARQALKGAGQEIARRNQSVYVFPEGTRSYSSEPMLLPFKKGAFHLAVEAGAPIVPCVVANYSHIFSIKGLVFRSGKIPVKVLAPIPTKGLTSADVEDLATKTREKMLEELITLSAEAKGTVPAAMKVAAASK